MTRRILTLAAIAMFLCGSSEATTETLYCRSDSHTINTVTAKKLLDSNSSTSSYIADGWGSALPGPVGTKGTYSVVTISIVHSDGTETSLGSSAASTTRTVSNTTAEGVQSATFSCSDTVIQPTDALKVVWGVHVQSEADVTETWISEQLQWSKLNASTWTFYRYSYVISTISGSGPYICAGEARIYYGDSTYTTYVEGIDYTLAQKGTCIIY